jgi:hypothetical protein
MTMSPQFRKLVLTAHITFSVGWLGAVAVFLIHAITGLNSPNLSIVQAAYLAMELSASLLIVPFCFGALVSGVVQSLGTQWGLFKHYWIVIKLILTIIITVLLLLHLEPIGNMAETAMTSTSTLSNIENRGLREQLVIQAAAAFLILLAITTISVYKPWGKISFDRRTGEAAKKGNKINIEKRGRMYLLIIVIGLILLIVILHLFGIDLGKH